MPDRSVASYALLPMVDLPELYSIHEHTRHKLLLETPDEEDLRVHEENRSLDLLNLHMQQVCPLLGLIGCRVEHVDLERSVVLAPLEGAAMNQNGTHQAAVFYLMADCALAIGVFGALPGVSIAGVHQRHSSLPIQFWTKRGSVTHHAAGSGALRAIAEIPQKTANQLRNELREHGHADCRSTVRLMQGERCVAEAEMTIGIFADTCHEAGASTTLIQAHNQKVSGLLIAGLRTDEVSERLADEQGRAIAARMSQILPQLPSLVHARSAHVEGYLRQHGSRFAQVVLVGGGFDSKPMRHRSEGQSWFTIDLASSQRARAKRLEAHAIESAEVAVVADVREPEWTERLRAAGCRFDRPTLFVFEGLSMYLAADELRSVLREMRSACEVPSSRLWLDHITARLFTMTQESLREFLSTMARLGEAFVTGFDSADLFQTSGWRVEDAASAASVVNVDDPIHQEYRFAVMAPT